MIQLTREQALELHELLLDVTHHWHPHPTEADYRCECCNKAAPTNHSQVIHVDGCPGMKLMGILEKALGEPDASSVVGSST